MTVLGIDIGNTQTVIGVFVEPDANSKPKVARTWKISTSPSESPDEVYVKLESLLRLEGFSISKIDTVVVSSVVPTYTGVLRSVFSKKNLKVIDHTWPFSFEIKAQPPSQVGADRLVNAEAAVREYGSPLVIVDMGTATTLCAIDESRAYLGGAIMPGIEISADTLARRTAKLFSVELVAPDRVIGRNTQNALQSGLIHGYASMIDGMIRKFKTELNPENAEKVRVVTTGGVSALLNGVCKEVTFTDPDLTLKGIYYLYESISQR